MTPNYLDKLRRAALIHLELLELDKVFGYAAPSPFNKLKGNLRLIKDGSWRARIIPDAFLTNASLAKNCYGEAILAAPGWTVVEVYIQERRRLAFSVREGDVILHRYEPGFWESWFGVDNKDDTTPYIAVLFANESDPAWARFMDSGLSKWPPRLNLTGSDPTAPM